YMALTGEYAICEISVPENWVGQTILGLNVRGRYNISVLAIKEGEKMLSMPGPEHTFAHGETMLVMGRNEDLQRFLK
ncbi:MAG: TrkA C-terminal domain-containing protein, partial [Gemmiger sp.]|nr:TrkA C-terminal domain-containing protein [Gemmiger sp.]